MSDAVNGVSESMEKLHLDAVTGEMVSKRYRSFLIHMMLNPI
jgi:hypothetical protein